MTVWELIGILSQHDPEERVSIELVDINHGAIKDDHDPDHGPSGQHLGGPALQRPKDNAMSKLSRAQYLRW